MTWTDQRKRQHEAVSVKDVGREWLLTCRCGAEVRGQDSVDMLRRHLDAVGAR